jgi:GlcNAc-P-P-Und epimerase
MMTGKQTVVLFGGTGFIGTHLAQHWLREGLAEKVVLVDLAPPRTEPYAADLQEGLRSGQVRYVAGDVRQPIAAEGLPDHADLIFNLAAVHREPGHEPREFFETNLAGAENVCAWASAAGCRQVVFMSSISPYGPSEEIRDERSVPVPETAYGSSKLAAEKIHFAWQAGCAARQLLIVRPGVVFGPGEGGNVTRLIRSLVKGYFLYMGNRQTRKAGGYVKELCRVVQFGLERMEAEKRRTLLLNFSMDPLPALEEFVTSIQKAAGLRRRPMRVPRWALLGASYPIEGVARVFGIRTPISPVRVRKLFRSTSIDPRGLRELGYTWKFTLDEAFVDWKRDAPGDFSAQGEQHPTINL